MRGQSRCVRSCGVRDPPKLEAFAIFSRHTIPPRSTVKPAIVFAALLALIFLTGGGSRQDISSLPLLRFLSACSVGIGLLALGGRTIKAIKWPLVLLGAIACLCLAQLIPLPNIAIQARDTAMALGTARAEAGGTGWQTVTFSRASTWNALASLIVPLAALVWFGTVRNARLTLQMLTAIAGVSALVGFLQLFADPRSAIFLYEITNNGSAVGLFANRNHQAVFLACGILTGSLLARSSAEPRERSGWILLCVVLGIAVLTNASRAGLLVLPVAALLGILIPIDPQVGKATKPGKKSFPFTSIAVVMAALVTVATFIVADRSPAFSRLLETNAQRELRDDLASSSLDILGASLPLGTGMGTYEHVYAARETAGMLQPAYVNEAHNDWLQFAVEGGVPGIALILGLLIFIILRTVSLVRSPPAECASLFNWAGLGIMLIIAIASAVDYPLRTPAMMTVGIIALALFAGPRLREQNLEMTV